MLSYADYPLVKNISFRWIKIAYLEMLLIQPIIEVVEYLYILSDVDPINTVNVV